MRNSGPCIRCNTIRLNLDKNERVEEFEPYATLTSFRSSPGLGVMFGMYYQMDVLETPNLYQQTLPTSYGYPSQMDSLRRNPMTTRDGEGDDQKYVKVNKFDGLILRCEKEMDWAKNLGAESLKKTK